MFSWVLIEREHHQSIVIGPFETEKKADAYQNCSEVNRFCEEDALDCKVISDTEKEKWTQTVKRNQWIQLYPLPNLLV